MDDDVIISMEGLWKRYGLSFMPQVRHYWNSLRTGNIRGFLEAPVDDRPWALRDINIEVKRGEMLGIIGRNGAGKSTLLKVLAGVTPVTRGRVEIKGRPFSMIELSAGIHRELTGRENARVLGAIMGLSRREIEEKMQDIEEFCELGRWFDQPVRIYSHGMLARLGFTVAIHTNPDILLVDEVLSVGDIAFRQKCTNWLDRYRGEKTVLFVSHNIGEVERLCDRAVYMEGGEVQFIGSVKEASAIYWETISDQILSQIRERFGTTPFPIKGTGDIRIVDVRLLNSGGEETTTFKHKSDLRVILEFEVKKTLKEPHFTVNILNPNMIPVAHSTTLGKVEKRRDLKPGRAQVECRLRNLQLLKGAYVIDVEVTDSKGVLKIGGMRNAAQFTVIEPPSDYHMVDTGHFALPAEWQFNVD